MPGISIHVVDVSRGLVAQGMRDEVHAAGGARRLLAAGSINDKGILDEAALAATFAAGTYEALFHVAAYYRTAGVTLPAVPFLDVVTMRVRSFASTTMAECQLTTLLLTVLGPWLKNGPWAIATCRVLHCIPKRVNCGHTNTGRRVGMRST